MTKSLNSCLLPPDGGALSTRVCCFQTGVMGTVCARVGGGLLDKVSGPLRFGARCLATTTHRTRSQTPTKLGERPFVSDLVDVIGTSE